MPSDVAARGVDIANGAPLSLGHELITDLELGLMLSVPPRELLSQFEHFHVGGLTAAVYRRQHVVSVLATRCFAPAFWVASPPIDDLEIMFPGPVAQKLIDCVIPLTRQHRPAFYVIGKRGRIRFRKTDLLQWLARGRPVKAY